LLTALFVPYQCFTRVRVLWTHFKLTFEALSLYDSKYVSMLSVEF